jgi:DNA-binding response OmpR family regulator
MKPDQTVLIIEDNCVFSKVVRKRFESRGYRTAVAFNGLEGYEMARRLKPDLILLDLMLPGLDGHKVCRLVKFDRSLRHTPVAIFTSRDTDADEAISRTAKADAYMLKTIRPETMMEIVRHLIEKRQGDGAGNGAGIDVPESGCLSVEREVA